MSEHEPENDLDAAPDPDQGRPSPVASKIDAIGWALLRWWGALFRAIFIAAIGVIGYFWFDPKPLGDVPLGALTLNQIFGNLFGVLVPIGCIYWFFKFPDSSDSSSNEDNPYVFWGQAGGWLLGLGILAFFWLNKK